MTKNTDIDLRIRHNESFKGNASAHNFQDYLILFLSLLSNHLLG